MKKLILCAAVYLLATPSQSQSIPFEAYKLATTFSASGWKSVEQGMPTLIAGIESQLRSAGATEKASRALAEQIRLNMTRDNITRVVAQSLSEEMSIDELKALDEFMESKVGKKYLRFNAELSSNPKHLMPLMKKSCEDASQRLDPVERASLSDVCSKF